MSCRQVSLLCCSAVQSPSITAFWKFNLLPQSCSYIHLHERSLPWLYQINTAFLLLTLGIFEKLFHRIFLAAYLNSAAFLHILYDSTKLIYWSKGGREERRKKRERKKELKKRDIELMNCRRTSSSLILLESPKKMRKRGDRRKILGETMAKNVPNLMKTKAHRFRNSMNSK